MTDDRIQDYNLIVKLQEERDELRKQCDDLRKELSGIESKRRDGEFTLDSYEERAAETKKEMDHLKDLAERLKKELAHEVSEKANVTSLLDEVHHDLAEAKNTLDAARKAKEEAKHHSLTLQTQLDQMVAEWEAEQAHICELEEKIEANKETEEELKTLQADMEDLRHVIEDSERASTVKDERITNLETNYQRALQRNLQNIETVRFNDERIRTAAASPTAEAPPTAMSVFSDTLESELNAALEDDSLIYYHLDESEVMTVFQEAPRAIVALKLSTELGQAMSTVPLDVPVPRVASTLASTVYVSEAVQIEPIRRQAAQRTFATQTDTSKLDMNLPQHAVVSTVPLQRSNVVSTSTSTQNEAVTTDVQEAPSTDQAVATDAGTDESPHEAASWQDGHANSTGWSKANDVCRPLTRPAARQRVSAYVTKILVLAFCVYLFLQLFAWEHDNSSTGAFGNGRYLFGFIPLAMGVGNSRLSELVSGTMSTAIAFIEDSMGINDQRILG